MNCFFKSAYCDFIYLLLVLIHVFDTTIVCCWLLNVVKYDVDVEVLICWVFHCYTRRFRLCFLQ